jgi:hypothetical protein
VEVEVEDRVDWEALEGSEEEEHLPRRPTLDLRTRGLLYVLFFSGLAYLLESLISGLADGLVGFAWTQSQLEQLQGMG